MLAEDEKTVEWLGVIERQQQEIELLRQKVAANGHNLDDGTSVTPSCSMEMTNMASLTMSVLRLPTDDSQVPMDSECYARICEKIERMRSELTIKNVKLQKARVQRNKEQKLAAHLRATMANMQMEMETQRMQFTRECTDLQDAIAKAADKETQALSRSEFLNAELCKMREVEVEQREDIRVQTMAVKAADIARERMSSELYQAHQDAARLASDVRALQTEKTHLQSSLERTQQELAARRQSDADLNELRIQTQEVQERAKELEKTVQQHAEQSHRQVELIDQQNRQIELLKEERVRAERVSAVERADNQRHAAHLLKNNMSLQYELECEQARSLKLREQAQEVTETAQLLAEELLQAKLEVSEQTQMSRQGEDKYCQLLNTYRGLRRQVQTLELSKRELVSMLIPTKKRLVLLQDTLTRFCYELDGVAKQMVTSRNREVSLGRALREYGKRNRGLQASVAAAQHQLRSIVSAVRNSDKRKEQAVCANWTLKRDLVIERCQRLNLVEQCKELESCLNSCQSSACETQKRAEGLERENGVLQHAVAQLVAYTQELARSQQLLQQELTKLEITGKRQPAVYG